MAGPGEWDRGLESDPTPVDRHHAIVERRGFFDVVSDQHRGEPGALPGLLDEGLHLDPGQGVEGPERFVQQQEAGVAGDGPGQRNPLLLAPGEGSEGQSFARSASPT